LLALLLVFWRSDSLVDFLISPRESGRFVEAVPKTSFRQRISGRIGKKIEKTLANLSSRKKITKKAHAGRGPESKWEIPVSISPEEAAVHDAIWEPVNPIHSFRDEANRRRKHMNDSRKQQLRRRRQMLSDKNG
jgi:hypothetical protein